MPTEATIRDRLIHVYVNYRAVRLLCIVAVAGATLLLFLLSGGFPPWAWHLLFQALPQVSTLLALHGESALLSLLGVALLALTQLLAGGGLIWLAWRMLAYWLYERQELLRFATDMQEAQYLAQSEEEQYADDYQYADQFEQEVYAYQQLEETEYPYQAEDGAYVYQGEEDEGDVEIYAEDPAAFWAYTNARIPQQGQLSAPPTPRSIVEPVTPAHLASSGARLSTEGLPAPTARVLTEKLQQPVARVLTDNLQHTSYGMFEAFAPPVPPAATPAMSKAPARQPTTVYPRESMSTVPLPAEPLVKRAGTSLVVSTGLDEGLKRKGQPNEDSLLVLKNTRLLRGQSCPVGLFVVADGMGGHENGQEASRLVIQSLSSNVMPALLTGPADDNYAELLTEGVHHANLALYQRNRQTKGDMGTTLAAAMIVNTTAYIANVGDSRVYLYRAASGLSQVTRDHSTVARLIEAGALKPEEIYTHPRRNEIYRSLGHRASEEVDSFTLALQPGDLLLLCSDGLWEMVRDTEIQRIIQSSPTQPAHLTPALVQAALDGGGKDNISVIVVYVQAEEGARSAWAS